MSKRRMVCLLSVVLVLLLSATGLRAQETLQPAYFEAWSPDSQSLVFTAYGQDGFDLYRIDRDGTHLEMLTQGVNAGDISVAPDGQKLALFRSQGETPGLYLLNLADKSLTLLLEQPNETWTLYWSPDSHYLLTMFRAPDENHIYDEVYDEMYDIWLIHVDTGDARIVTKDPVHRPEIDWSPDGSRFYVGGRLVDPVTKGYVPFLTVYDTAGETASVNLIERYWNEIRFCCATASAWSSDGTHLAVNIAGDGNIYDIDIQTGALKPLAYVGGQVFGLHWSADGREMRYEPGNSAYSDATQPSIGYEPGVYRLNLADGQPHLVQPQGRNGIVPSADGTQLAVFPYPRSRQAFTMSFINLADGTQQQSDLAYTNVSTLGWSPDGRLFAAALCIQGRYDIFVLDAATGQATDLTNSETAASGDVNDVTCGGYG